MKLQRILLLSGAILLIGLLSYWLAFVRPFIQIDQARLTASMIEVRSNSPGRLARLSVAEGSWVERGEILFSLNAAKEELFQAELQAKIESLRKALSGHLLEVETAMQEYLTARTDLVIGLEDRSEFPLARLEQQQKMADFCKKEIGLAEQDFELTKQAIQDKSCAAPASGFVIKCQKQIGEQLQAGDAVCLLCNPKTMWVEAIVPESYASKIRVGQKAFVALLTDSSFRCKGELSWISPVALQGHAGIPIRISLEEGYPDCLRPNLQVQLTLKIR